MFNTWPPGTFLPKDKKTLSPFIFLYLFQINKRKTACRRPTRRAAAFKG
jgi:hypothetical protein